jgi:hypothetical protein
MGATLLLLPDGGTPSIQPRAESAPNLLGSRDIGVDLGSRKNTSGQALAARQPETSALLRARD